MCVKMRKCNNFVCQTIGGENEKSVHTVLFVKKKIIIILKQFYTLHCILCAFCCKTLEILWHLFKTPIVRGWQENLSSWTCNDLRFSRERGVKVVSSYIRLIPEYLISLTLWEIYLSRLIYQAEIRNANIARVAAVIIASNRIA